jgi:hypothetical protein
MYIPFFFLPPSPRVPFFLVSRLDVRGMSSDESDFLVLRVALALDLLATGLAVAVVRAMAK